jgi:hypothetical protein
LIRLFDPLRQVSFRAAFVALPGLGKGTAAGLDGYASAADVAQPKRTAERFPSQIVDREELGATGMRGPVVRGSDSRSVV